MLQWVADGSPSKSTPIKVESPNQFVPLGTNKKEFKKIQAAVSVFYTYYEIKFDSLFGQNLKGTSCKLPSELMRARDLMPQLCMYALSRS